VKLDEETRAQLAAAAYWTRQSANAIVEQGIAVMLKRLREAHNGGRPFPPRPQEPTAAQPLGAAEDTTGDGVGKPKGRRTKGKE
jgi:hypothetical protein